MTNLVLNFNAVATAKFGTNTRLRVKPMTRGGTEYVAVRPSYRVSGKNAMIRTSKNEDGTFSADLPESLFADLALPELKSSHTNYLMDDVGYGWFLMRAEGELTDKDAIITVSKARKAPAKKTPHVTEEQPADAGQAAEAAPAAETAEKQALDAGAAEEAEVAGEAPAVVVAEPTVEKTVAKKVTATKVKVKKHAPKKVATTKVAEKDAS